jgi:hypothetical protein
LPSLPRSQRAPGLRLLCRLPRLHRSYDRALADLQANDSNAPETLRYREMLAQVGGGFVPPVAHSEVMAALKSDAAQQQP